MTHGLFCLQSKFSCSVFVAMNVVIQSSVIIYSPEM